MTNKIHDIIVGEFLRREMGQFIDTFEWSEHTVELRKHDTDEVANWCDENVGLCLSLGQVDSHITCAVCLRTIRHANHLRVLRYDWLRVMATSKYDYIYLFRRDQDAVHFKLRWF